MKNQQKELELNKLQKLERDDPKKFWQGVKKFVKPICKLFNTILDSGNFPTQWATSIIVPLFKGGNSSDVNNYRGIAVSSCISKVLTKIINTRIYNYCCEKDIFAINQSGFMNGRRTDDNIFTLNTIINSQIKHKKGKLFTAFVDFQKFVDCINRDMLFYKLQKIGITGKLYYVLKSIYSKLLLLY